MFLISQGLARFSFSWVALALVVLPLMTACPAETPDADAGSSDITDSGSSSGNIDSGSLPTADGGSVVADGGSVVADGGSVVADGGSVVADGGSVVADGGSVVADGGSVVADGGSVVADGGSVVADGGSVAADAGSGELPLPADAGPVDDTPAPLTREAACVEATMLENGVAVRGDTTLYPDFFQPACILGNRGNNERVYTYTTQAPLSEITVQARGDNDLDLVLTLRTDCLDDASEEACVDGKAGGLPENATLTQVAAGTQIFIMVDGYNTDDVGVFTLSLIETEIPVLAEGEACNSNASGTEAICNPDVVGLDCLVDSGQQVCAVLEVLVRGDTCVLEDTAAICDDSQGDSCINYGQGSFFCNNRVDAKCENAVSLSVGVLGSHTALYRDMRGSCGGSFSAEAAFTYTVQADRAIVSFAGDSGVSAIYARRDCADESSEVACNSRNSLELFNVRQGETYTVFAEGATDTEVTLTATETALTLLPTNAVCDPAATAELCNFERDLECLVLNGENHCVEQQILAPNDLCIQGDTAAICEQGAGFVCLSDGIDDRCLNPEVQQCLAPTPITGGTLSSAPLAADVTQGSCGGSNTAEAAFTYVVQNTNARVTFFSFAALSNLYVRSDCTAPGTELACASNQSNVVVNAAAGDVLTVFAENNNGTEVLLGAVEQEIVVLAEGAACEPASEVVICDENGGMRCLDLDGTGDKCTDTQVYNNTCDTATPLVGAGGTVGGDLTYATNDYDAQELGGCGHSYASAGTDVVYSVVLEPGQTINAEITHESDESILLLDSCPPTANACVAGEDNGGGSEEVHYTSVNGGTYFIVVDDYGASSNGGIYSLVWSIN